MSRERARRRAARLAQEQAALAKRARRVARRARRRALLRRLKPRWVGRRTGRIGRRSRGERSAIVALSLAAVLLIWSLVEPLALRLALTILLLISLPAIVIVALGRRT